MSPDLVAEEVRSVLTADLLHRRYRGLARRTPTAGHCYAASEACFHLLGGRAAGWRAECVRHEGGVHWYLRHDDGTILDPTADQFLTPPPYDQGRRIGFLTLAPSMRAREIIRRLSGRF